MNIVLGFPQQDKQTGLYIKEGFEELGHKIVAINDPRVFPGPDQILMLADEYKPDFVFIAKDPRYNEIIEKLMVFNRYTRINMFYSYFHLYKYN